MDESLHGSKHIIRNAMLAIGGYTAVVLGVYFRVWWPWIAHRRFFGWDCIREYWQDIVFQVEALRAAEWPLWNPHSLMGYSAIGDPQSGLFSPVHWLMWIVSFVVGDTGAWLIQAKVLVTMVIGLCGMHVLVRHLTGSRLAGILCALTYLFGGTLLIHKDGSMLWPLMYLPWAVFALHRFMARPATGAAVWLAISVALCGTAGHPPCFFYSLLVLALYWAAETLLPLRCALRKLRRQTVPLVIAGAVTLGLLLPMLVPAAVATLYSPRNHRGLAYALGLPLSWSDLGGVIWPLHAYNSFYDLHMGPLVPCAIAITLFSLVVRRRSTRPKVTWLVIATIGLAFALGEHLPLLRWCVEHLPGFGLFRIAYRYKFVFAFCICISAGYVLSDIFLATRRTRRELSATWIAVVMGWVGVTVLGVTYYTPKPVVDFVSAHFWATMTSAVILSLVTSILLFPTRRQWFATLLVAAVLAQLVFSGWVTLDVRQPPPNIDALRDKISRMPGVAQKQWRMSQHRYGDGGNTAVVFGIREFSGYTALPTLLQRYEDVLHAARRKPAMLRHFNVRWLLSGPHQRKPDFIPHGNHLYELTNPVPLVRGYTQVERATPIHALARLEQPLPLTVALVPPSVAVPRVVNTRPNVKLMVDGTVTHFSKNEIAATLTMPQPGVVVINEPHYPGWRAWVNGKPAPIFYANYLLRGIVVPAGAVHIRLRFEPQGQMALFGLFFATVGLLLTAGTFAWRRRRRKYSKM